METENEHIELKIAGQDGSVARFRIKRHTQLGKLMKAYCCRRVGAGTARRLLRPRGDPKGSATPAAPTLPGEASPCWWNPRCFSARIVEHACGQGEGVQVCGRTRSWDAGSSSVRSSYR